MKKIFFKRLAALILACCVLLALLAGCSPQEQAPSADPAATAAPESPAAPETPGAPEPPAAPDPDAKDGTYTTAAMGRNGQVTVATTFSGGKITKVDVQDHIETSVYTDRAIPVLSTAIVENNSYNVDVVAGATATCSAIKRAVYDAIDQAGGTAAAYESKPDVIPAADETIDVDVAVIGAGVSGIMSALNASDAGAKVALIEKTTILGGCSLQSFATSAFGMKHNVEAGEDTEAGILEKFNNWIVTEGYRADATLVNTYLKNGGAALDYYMDLGLLAVRDFFGMQMTMLTDYDGRQPLYEKALDERVVQKGGAVYRETTAKSLIQTGDTITGVVCKRADGSTLTVNAKAVVIATGGYGGDAERVYRDSGVRAVAGCLTQTVGEGIDMAWAVGAKVPPNLGGLQLHQTLATSNLTGFEYFQMRYPMITTYLQPLLNVSNKGIRFRNEEWASNAVAASNSAAFTGGYTYVLLSQSTLDKLEQGGIAAIGADASPAMPPEYKPAFELDTPWPDTKAVFDAMVEGGWGFYGETIEALAANAGFDVDTFKNTFETYQAYCRNGKDEYFNKPARYLVEYEYGPYYLVESTYNQLGTVTGLVVNSGFQVLDVNDNPIPGLYSCGSDASSTLYNSMYMGAGDAIGFAITSGKVSGENAAAFAK
ncbi:MAG: FAD-binding protein [Clostridiales bacterium]|jgi:fumarate reductase flavoprotein subunit|nr:FAD-binding protein [Clostridiales bacterium]